jgi:molybdopterin synthase sulfur carrier subunit
VRAVVRLPAALRAHSGGSAEVRLDLPPGSPATVATVLDALACAHPAVERRIRDERGVLRRHVNLFLDGENARDLGGLAAPIRDGDELLVLAAVSGG